MGIKRVAGLGTGLDLDLQEGGTFSQTVRLISL
jgi:hypothetical protein